MNQNLAEIGTPAPDQRPLSLGLRLVLAAALVLLVLVIGQPSLDAPWILGDEFAFIVNNPDVTGENLEVSAFRRYLEIFLHTHEDLYQPFTILTYAIQWDLGGNRVFQIRLVDLLIHALNALLIWKVLAALLARVSVAPRVLRQGIAWSLAFIWALHPMLAGAWAADMGRTHLLAATFCLLSLLCHLRHIDGLRAAGSSRTATWLWFGGAYALLLLAMINKPVVGWIVILFVLEWILLGLRRTLLAPRIYLVGITCAAFALLTLTTTRDTFALDEMALPIFGNPISRALLGMWIYLRNFVAPFTWLSPWYPPDINTGWTHPEVIAGAGLLLLGALTALFATRRPTTRGVTLGLIWFAATWLPISGVVGARVLAAQDRYMYLPIMGLLLAIGIGLLAWLGRNAERARLRAFVVMATAAVLMLAATPWDRQICREARSALRRAESAVEHNPNDPRVLEFLAATYDYCRGHPIPDDPEFDPVKYYDLSIRAYQAAAALGDRSPEYFPDTRSRAEFHRRISFNFWKLGRFEESLEQAQRAADFEPDAPLTVTRFAHAYRALERWPETLAAYQKLYEIVPQDSVARPFRLLEYADLLVNRFDAPDRALPLYYEILDLPRLEPDQVRLAFLGAARCEVLAGQGSVGYDLALQVFQAEPNNLEAARIIAQYFLRSHEWEKADRAYRGILSQVPTDYESLRGFQNVCLINGNWTDAAFAWQKACETESDNLIFRSHFVWSATCAGQPAAAEWAGKLLEESPENRFACLSMMLIELRQDHVDVALDWIRRAAAGAELPLARELVRAEATLDKMIERGELTADAQLARAALLRATGSEERYREVLDKYIAETPNSKWRSLAEQMREQEVQP